MGISIYLNMLLYIYIYTHIFILFSSAKIKDVNILSVNYKQILYLQVTFYK